MALEKYIVFPPGVDFATMLGERGVGRSVEEMLDEELQVLEEDDDEEEDEETAVDGVERKEKDESIPPNGTENSARDAMEVEGVVSLAAEEDEDVRMDLVDGNDEHAKDEDGMDVDDARAPEKKRKRNHEGEDEEDQMQADDEDEDDDGVERVVMRPRKKALPAASHSPAQTQRKGLTSRLQEKGMRGAEQSSATTRVKKSKPQEKAKENDSDSPASEVVRVTKRRSGRLEMQVESPHSRAKTGKGRVETEIDESSEDDEIEFVEVRTPASKGKRNEKVVARKKLVGRAGKRHDSWTEEDEGKEKKKTKKSPGKKFGDSDAEVSVRKAKKTPARKVSSDEEEEVMTKRKKAPARNAPSSEEEEEEDEMVLLKTKSKAKKSPPKKVDSDEESDEPVEAEDEEEPIRSTRSTRAAVRASTSVTKGRGRPKAISASDEDEGESEADLPAPPKAKSKAKGKEAEKSKERPKPRPIAKAQVTEQTTELESEATEEDLKLSPIKPAKTKGKAASTTASSAKKPNENGPVASSVSPSKTPKRVVSVLIPPLTLTPKISPKQAGTSHSHLTRAESIRVAAGEHPRVSASRPSAAATVSGSKPTASGSGSASKAKSRTTATKFVEEESSPALSGPENVVVVSGRSKRNAATKATQKLHDEIMPDVMNYQQEMRSKGKGRKSSGVEVQTNGSDKQKRVSEEGQEEGGDKKRRRVSDVPMKRKTPTTEEEDEEDDVKVVKSSGKAKAKKAVRLAVTESEGSDVQMVNTTGVKAKKGKERVIDGHSRFFQSFPYPTPQVWLRL